MIDGDNQVMDINQAMKTVCEAVKAQKRPEIGKAVKIVMKAVKDHEDCNNNLTKMKNQFADEALKMFSTISSEKVQNEKLKIFSEKMIRENKDLKGGNKHVSQNVSLTKKVDMLEKELTETKEKLTKTEEKLTKTDEKLTKTEEKLTKTIEEQRKQREILLRLAARFDKIDKPSDSDAVDGPSTN